VPVHWQRVDSVNERAKRVRCCDRPLTFSRDSGRILRGVVKTTHMKNTLIIQRNYLHYVSKYQVRAELSSPFSRACVGQRFEKRHKNLPVHVSPCFRVNVGDTVEVGQCRPLSKTVRFNVLKIVKSQSNKKFKKF
jgi:small subunit ribosomal protein S11e